MNIINIDPWNQKIQIMKMESLSDSNDDDNFINNLMKEAIEIDENLKIAAYPVIGKEKRFFYIIKQYDDRVRAYPFEGMGIAFGKIDEEMVKELEDSIVWH